MKHNAEKGLETEDRLNTFLRLMDVLLQGVIGPTIVTSYVRVTTKDTLGIFRKTNLFKAMERLPRMAIDVSS